MISRENVIEVLCGKSRKCVSIKTVSGENGFKPPVAKTHKVYLETNAHLENLMQKEKGLNNQFACLGIPRKLFSPSCVKVYAGA